MARTIRSIAPPIRMPMLLDIPSSICCVNAGCPENSTVTPGGCSVCSTSEITLFIAARWTSSDTLSSSWTWTRVRLLEGLTSCWVADGSAPTIRSISALEDGRIPPLALFRTPTILWVPLIFSCCRISVSRLSRYDKIAGSRGSLVSMIRIMVESGWKFSVYSA
ncbi:MAG: hypothetical protein BWY93_01313 [Euryarchaeota archaeon ADurb.BinA087]|nr:MAG: hypothetical protein BWY93_01313 [Euryarchaeota archaeon ADurb.BinA087]